MHGLFTHSFALGLKNTNKHSVSLFLVLIFLTPLLHAAVDGLPSDNYDDYDEPKYQNISNNSTGDYNSAVQSYNIEAAQLNQLQNQKENLNREIDQISRELYENYREQERLNREMDRNYQQQKEEYQQLNRMTRELENLARQGKELENQKAMLQKRLEPLRQNLEKETAQLKRLEDLEKNAKEPLDNTQKQMNENKKQISELQNTLNVLDDQVVEVDSQLTQLRKKLQETQNPREKEQLRNQIASKEAYHSELKSQIASKKENLKTFRSQQQSLQADIEKLQKTYNIALDATEAQRKTVSQVNERIDAVQKNINESQAALAQNDRATKELNRDYNQKKRHYEELQQDSQKMSRRFESIKRNAQENELTKSRRLQDLDQLNLTIATQIQRVDSARYQMLSAQERMNADLRRLQEVQSFLSTAEYIMKNQVAGPEGSADGQNEGISLATQDGRQNGDRDGTQRGLQTAYDTGYGTGLNEGHTNGTDKVSYKRGYDQGSIIGRNRADQEAQPQEQLGYNEREQEYLNAPLNKVVVGPWAPQNTTTWAPQNQNAMTNETERLWATPPSPDLSKIKLNILSGKSFDFKNSSATDLQSNVEGFYTQITANTLQQIQLNKFTQVQNSNAVLVNYLQTAQNNLTQTYYNPRPKNYPHPKITEFYNTHYNSDFNSNKKSAYNETYPGVYADSENKAFDQNKNNPQKTQEGYKVGLAQGSEEKGLKDGNEQTYATNIENFKQQYKQAGRNRASQYYDSNAVLKFVSSQIVETDNDGIFRPGDAVEIQITLKNFGRKAESSLKADLRDQSTFPVLDSVQNSVALAQLPPQSEITLTGVLMNHIQTSTKTGTNLKTKLQVLNSNGTSLYQAQLSALVQYPTTLTLNNYDGVFVPGETKNLQLVIKNLSRKNQTLDFSLQYDSEKLNLTTEPLNALQVPAQSTKVIQVTAKGSPSAEFESTEIALQTMQAGLKFAEEMNLTPTIIRRHKTNDNSLGLILSGDLSKGGGKILYNMAQQNNSSKKYDTWDLRVDGSDQLSSTLLAYKGRLVHLMVEDALSLNSTTQSALFNYTNYGGSLILWAQNPNQLNQLSQLVGVQSQSSSSSYFAQLRGSYVLKSLNPSVQGVVNFLSPTTVKSIVTLNGNGNDQNLGFVSHQGEFTNNLSRFLVLGFSPYSLNHDDLNQIAGRFYSWQLSFEQKINFALQSESQLLPVLDDLLEEIRDDLVREDVTWFRSSGNSSKMTFAIQKLLSKDNANRNAFIKSYPQIYDYVEKIKDGDIRIPVQRLMSDVKVGSGWSKTSWEQAYCDKYKSDRSDLCGGNGFWP